MHSLIKNDYMNKMMKKTIDIDAFKAHIENNNFLNVIYFDTNELQKTYKDVTKKTILLSEINSINAGTKIGANLGLINMEINSGKAQETEEYYTPKELIIKIIDDKIYKTNLLVFKIRISDIGSEVKVNGVTVLKKISAFRILKSNTPRTVKGREKKNTELFEKVYLSLKPSFTYGIIHEFLFNEKTLFTNPKPDIEKDDFYLICLPNAFSQVRELDVYGNGENYLLIEPLILIRDNI